MARATSREPLRPTQGPKRSAEAQESARAWCSYTIVPARGRKDEEGFLNVRKALCSYPPFRTDLRRLRNQFFTKKKSQEWLEEQANSLCERWEIDGKEWISWLVQNWSPDLIAHPPDEPLAIRPVLRPWVIRLEGVSDEERSKFGYWLVEPQYFRAVVILYRGISKTDAKKAAEEAVKALNLDHKAKSGRTPLPETHRKTLRNYFAEHAVGKPKPGLQEQMYRRIHQAMNKQGMPVSRSTIASEHRHWRRERGEPVKCYVHG